MDEDTDLKSAGPKGFGGSIPSASVMKIEEFEDELWRVCFEVWRAVDLTMSLAEDDAIYTRYFENKDIFNFKTAPTLIGTFEDKKLAHWLFKLTKDLAEGSFRYYPDTWSITEQKKWKQRYDKI